MKAQHVIISGLLGLQLGLGGSVWGNEAVPKRVSLKQQATLKDHAEQAVGPVTSVPPTKKRPTINAATHKGKRPPEGVPQEARQEGSVTGVKTDGRSDPSVLIVPRYLPQVDTIAIGSMEDARDSGGARTMAWMDRNHDGVVDPMERVLGYRVMSLRGDVGLRQSELMAERAWQQAEAQALSRAIRGIASQGETLKSQDLLPPVKGSQKKSAPSPRLSRS